MKREDVMALQRRLGVTADGVVGPKTIAALWSALDRAGIGAPQPDPPPLPGLGAAPVPPIAMISAALIRKACPARTEQQLAQWVGPIRSACQRFEINTIRRVAAFIAQVAHESMCYTALDENMRYSAKRMAEVWPTRYAVNPAVKDPKARQPNATAIRLAAQGPEAIANHVYANRLGNGPPESGDGWKFRGGAGIHLTGRANWTDFARAMRMTVDEALAYGRTPEGAIAAAAWFWEANDINRLADTPGVADESKAINGGANGLADRKAKFDALVEEMLRLERAAR
jgi:putative chitinase